MKLMTLGIFWVCHYGILYPAVLQPTGHPASLGLSLPVLRAACSATEPLSARVPLPAADCVGGLQHRFISCNSKAREASSTVISSCGANKKAPGQRKLQVKRTSASSQVETVS